MRAERIVKRQAQRQQLADYKKRFQDMKPLLEAQQKLNDAYQRGVQHGLAYAVERIVNAAKELTYD